MITNRFSHGDLITIKDPEHSDQPRVKAMFIGAVKVKDYETMARVKLTEYSPNPPTVLVPFWTIQPRSVDVLFDPSMISVPSPDVQPMLTAAKAQEEAAKKAAAIKAMTSILGHQSTP